MARGSTVLVPPGSKVIIDAAYPPPTSSWGIAGCGRYSSTNPNNPKNLKDSEVDDAERHDKGLLFFVEQAEQTPVNSTLEDDKALARAAVAQATRQGLPHDSPMWYAVDTSPFGFFDTIANSFEVYRDISGGWPTACYGGSQLIEYLMERGLITYGHIPAALSWSVTSAPENGTTVFKIPGSSLRWYRTPAAHMRQYPSTTYQGAGVDFNDALQDVPAWFPGRTAPPEEEFLSTTQFDILMKRLAEVQQAVADNATAVADRAEAAVAAALAKTQGNVDYTRDTLVNHITAHVVQSMGPGGPATGEFAAKVRGYVEDMLKRYTVAGPPGPAGPAGPAGTVTPGTKINISGTGTVT